MKSTIRLILLAVSVGAVLAAPAAAQVRHRVAQAPSATAIFPAASHGPDVIQQGRYLGTDPDVNVRSLIGKDDVSHNGNGY